MRPHTQPEPGGLCVPTRKVVPLYVRDILPTFCPHFGYFWGPSGAAGKRQTRCYASDFDPNVREGHWRRAWDSNPRPSRKNCCNCSKFWEVDPRFAHLLPTFFKIFSEGWCLTGPHDPRERPGLTWLRQSPSRPQTSPRKCQESSLRRRALTSVE